MFLWASGPWNAFLGQDPSSAHRRRCVSMSFFKKGIKKLKFEKGAGWEKLGKWVHPILWSGGRRGAGDLPPTHRAGGSKKISRSLFANKKSFLFAKRPLKQVFRPASGREVPWLFLLYFLRIYISQTIWNSDFFQIQDLFALLLCMHIKF
jgi:hypothetical protein